MFRGQNSLVITLGAAGSALLVFVILGARVTASSVMLSIVGATCWLVAVASWRTLMPLLSKEEEATSGPRQVAEGRRREILEREKQRLLRSIKELEFDRAMGKVSAGDFGDLAASLRARALRVLRQLNASDHAYRDLIEAELRDRLAHRGVSPSPSAVEARGKAAREPASAPAATTRHVCAVCETSNDPDARFCKQCGNRF